MMDAKLALTWKALLTGSLAICLSSCGGESADEPDAVGTRIVTVTVAEAATSEIREELFSVGRVVSRNTPTLAAEVNARVVEINVDDGQPVRQGQVLIKLDSTAFELAVQEAQAVIRQLNASIENGQTRVTRYRNLKTRDVMPQERLDDAEAALAVDQASLAAAEARLAIVRDRLAKTVVESPFDGVVERRHVSMGDYVREGGPLVSLTDIINLRVEMPFPETVGHLLKTGQVMQLESPVAPGLAVRAVVNEILPQVSATNRSLMAVSHIVNPGPWKPLATVEGVLVVDTRPIAIVVPYAAVVKRPAGDVLYRLDSLQNPVVHEVPVITGVRRNGEIEIREGLEHADIIVVEGARYLTDGAQVAVPESPK